MSPESLEEYIDDDNTVRVVDAYVDELNLFEMDFERVKPFCVSVSIWRIRYVACSKPLGYVYLQR
ncbi:MAG: hypothetical protein ABJ275_07335 [Maricaulaceae bacterium]